MDCPTGRARGSHAGCSRGPGMGTSSAWPGLSLQREAAAHTQTWGRCPVENAAWVSLFFSVFPGIVPPPCSWWTVTEHGSGQGQLESSQV